MKLFYSTKQNGTQIHLHHHHHHVYHHSSMPTDPYSSHLDHRSSPYNSQISLTLTGTGTTHESSQGYHSISTSPTTIHNAIPTTTTTTENLNKENLRTPLSFRNPLFHDQILEQQGQSIPSDSDDDDDDDDDRSNGPTNFARTDSSRALYFVNNLCLESQRDFSSPSQSLVHSASRQSLAQPPTSPTFICS